MSPAEPLHVIIADDHLLVAQALQKLLTADFRVVAIVHDGRKLIEAAIELTPDIILVDINMPVLNGLHAGERIKRQLPQTKVIYVTVASDPDLVSEAFARGADGFVAKTAAPSELLTAVRCALYGKHYASGGLPDHGSIHENTATNNRGVRCELSDRELDILQLLAEGHSIKQVADVLNLKTRTATFYKYRIRESLKLRNDAELVYYALQHHIIDGR